MLSRRAPPPLLPQKVFCWFGEVRIPGEPIGTQTPIANPKMKECVEKDSFTPQTKSTTEATMVRSFRKMLLAITALLGAATIPATGLRVRDEAACLLGTTSIGRLHRV